MKRSCLLAGLVSLTLALRATADDPPQNPTMAQNPQMMELAKQCNVTPAQLSSMRAQGMGWGEIGHALAISQKAGVPVDDVLKSRRSGLGWGKIAGKYGLKLGAVNAKARDIQRAGQKVEAQGPEGAGGRMGSGGQGGMGSGDHMSGDHMGGDHMGPGESMGRGGGAMGAGHEPHGGPRR